MLWAKAGVQMEIHTALEQSHISHWDTRGQRGRLAQFQHSGTPWAAHQGRSLTVGKLCPWDLESLEDALQEKITPGGGLMAGTETAPQPLSFHEDTGRSFLPNCQELLRNFSAVHKKWTLAVLCQQQRLCSGQNTLENNCSSH